MDEKRGLKINFMGIISVMTLIVMGIGSTFAFFTASMKNKADEYISVSSLEVVINLGVLPKYNGKRILPTNDEDIHKAYKNKCEDHYKNGACIAYTVEIENGGRELAGVISFSATSDSITNLKYMIVSSDEEYEVLKEPTKAMDATNEEQFSGIPITIPGKTKKEVVIVLWISNLKDTAQDWEQGGIFEGKVSFDTTSGAQITGTMTENVVVNPTT